MRGGRERDDERFLSYSYIHLTLLTEPSSLGTTYIKYPALLSHFQYSTHVCCIFHFSAKPIQDGRDMSVSEFISPHRFFLLSETNLNNTTIPFYNTKHRRIIFYYFIRRSLTTKIWSKISATSSLNCFNLEKKQPHDEPVHDHTQNLRHLLQNYTLLSNTIHPTFF